VPVDDSKIPGPVLKGPKPRNTRNSTKAGFTTEDVTVTKPRQPSTLSESLRKSHLADYQLLKATSHMSTGDIPNSQTTENMPPKTVSEKRMVTPGSRDAPKFSSQSPEGLRRFIRVMEDLWKDAGVESNDIKKSMIGKYADEDCEEEWTAFTTYGEGHSWDEFKAELIENYPEAAAAERGTPARLRQLCAEQVKVHLGDMPSLYSFRRAFMAEAKKLQKPPAAMGNREMVELFIGCLTEAFASAVLQFLGNQTPKTTSLRTRAPDGEAAAATAIVTERRPEDRYDLKEICQAAIQVSTNSQGMFSLLKKDLTSHTNQRGAFMFNQPVSETNALTQKVEELEGIQALEKDRLVTMNKTLESKMGGLEDLLKTLLLQGKSGEHHHPSCGSDCKRDHGKTHEPSSGPPQRWGAKSLENETCFWCKEIGHFAADCPDQKEQIRIGNLKVNPEGKLRLKDGSLIPHYPPGLSMKERVARHYARKPSQYFYGEYDDVDPISPPTPKYSQYLGTSETAEQRITRLEAELELRKREEALAQRKRRLEQDEKKLEQSSSRTVNTLDLLGQLTDEEVLAITAARSGFP
jgi:hypothetical protein